MSKLSLILQFKINYDRVEITIKLSLGIPITEITLSLNSSF
jgi:hypothetical protein